MSKRRLGAAVRRVCSHRVVVSVSRWTTQVTGNNGSAPCIESVGQLRQVAARSAAVLRAAKVRDCQLCGFEAEVGAQGLGGEQHCREDKERCHGHKRGAGGLLSWQLRLSQGTPVEAFR